MRQELGPRLRGGDEAGKIPGPIHFTFSAQRLYRAVPVSAGYGDKLRCIIDAMDPGAVPGGSTKRPGSLARGAGFLMGPNQDRHALKGIVFARNEHSVKSLFHKCQR